MTAYLVRSTPEGSNRPHEFVGLFSASSVRGLADLIDECCAPGDCEYARLPDGGFFAPGVAPTVPISVPVNDQDPGVNATFLGGDAGLALTGFWYDRLIGWGDALQWRRFSAEWPRGPHE